LDTRDQPFITLWQNIYRALKQSNEDSKMSAKKSHSEECTARTPAIVERADFGWPRAIDAKISIDCWCKRANNASNYRGESSIQIIHIKYDRCSLKLPEQTELFASAPLLTSQQPRFKSLGLLWSVVERVTNKSHFNDVIKNYFWGSIRRHGQHACECFRPL